MPGLEDVGLKRMKQARRLDSTLAAEELRQKLQREFREREARRARTNDNKG